MSGRARGSSGRASEVSPARARRRPEASRGCQDDPREGAGRAPPSYGRAIMWMSARSGVGGRRRRAVAVDVGSRWVRVCVPGGPVVNRPAGGGLRGSLQQAFVAADAGRHPDVVLCAPPTLGTRERVALEQQALDAGARSALTIESGLAAAIGSGLPVAEEHGCLVADIGAGRCEAALVASGRVALARVGIYADYPDRPAEDVVVDTALRLIEDVWQSGMIDALDEGLTLVGGGARVDSVVSLVAQSCPVGVRTPPRPEECAVRGATHVFEEMRTYSRLARRRR